jgi:hypothetical protein
MYNFYFGHLVIWLNLNSWNFKFSNEVQTKFWNTKWFLLKKWWIPKLFNSWRSTTFILVISSFDKLLVHIVHKTYISLMSFMKPYERDVNFVNNIIITLSDGQMTKIKVEDLDMLFNFCIHHFFWWNHLGFQNHVWSCPFSKFQNLNYPNFVTRKD